MLRDGPYHLPAHRANFFFWTRFQLRKFSEPAGVRVHPNFGVHLQSSNNVSGL